MRALALPTDILTRNLSDLTPEQREALGLRRPATDEEVAAYDQAHQPAGAPADFGGMVIPNPNGIQVSDDTDPGIPDTKLDGATFQRQNFTGPTRVGLASTPGKIALPPGAELEQAPAGGDQDLKLPPGAELETNENKTPPSKFSHIAENFLSGLGVTDDAGAKKFFEHPISTALDALGGQGELAKKAKAAYDRGDYKGAIMHGLNYLVPFIGQQTDQAGEQLNAADISGGISRTLGAAVPIVAGSPEVQSSVGDAASAAVRPIKPLLSKVGKAATAVGQTVDPDVAGLLSPRTAHALRLSQKVGRVATKLGKTAAPAAVEAEAEAAAPAKLPAAFDPAPAPYKPPAGTADNPAQLGMRAKVEPPRSSAKLPAAFDPAPAPYEAPAGTADNPAQVTRLPEPKTEAGAEPETETAQPETRGSGDQKLHRLSGDSALRKVLTGQDNANLLKIAKSRGINVSQEAQLKPGIADDRLINKIINDHSPDELEDIADTYDQSTRNRHDFGDIGPEAWKTLSMQTYFPDVKIPAAAAARTQTAIEAASPLAKKVGNLSDFIRPGKAAAAEGEAEATPTPKPKQVKGKASTPAASAPAATPSTDLTSMLQKSLDQVQAGKGGVFTSAEPKMLLDRWGVDPESFAEGRSQTRGMSEGESKASINKLVKAYKSGQAPEPVLETRDANNNLISVDGRGRALAAHKAGIERIPIIVRRLAAVPQ